MSCYVSQLKQICKYLFWYVSNNRIRFYNKPFYELRIHSKFAINIYLTFRTYNFTNSVMELYWFFFNNMIAPINLFFCDFIWKFLLYNMYYRFIFFISTIRLGQRLVLQPNIWHTVSRNRNFIFYIKLNMHIIYNLMFYHLLYINVFIPFKSSSM